MTLACEDANSKLVEVVSVAEDHVGNSLLQIWELTFLPKARLLFRLWAQGLVMILKLKLRQDFEAGVWSVFCRWCFVEVTKLNLGRDSKAIFWCLSFSRDADAWLRFDMAPYLKVTLESWIQLSGPLCLWQCFYTLLLSTVQPLLHCFFSLFFWRMYICIKSTFKDFQNQV